MYIKHSKFRNTGILFEVIVRKITSETLSGKDSPAIEILKSYFVNTELGKVNIIEYNPIDDGEFQQADIDKVDAFANYLEKKNIIVHVRRRL